MSLERVFVPDTLPTRSRTLRAHAGRFALVPLPRGEEGPLPEAYHSDDSARFVPAPYGFEGIDVGDAPVVDTVCDRALPEATGDGRLLYGLGARVLEAAATARTAASENSESLRHNAGEALASARDNAGEVLSKARETASHALSSAKESASDTATAARDAAASADLGGKASKLADELVALVSTRVEALGDAIKARLPKS